MEPIGLLSIEDAFLLWVPFFLTLLKIFIVSALAVGFIAILATALGNKFGNNKANPVEGGISAFVLWLVGMITGYIAGVSRDTVTGDVLPVLLTGFAVLASYAVLQSKIGLLAAGAATTLFAVAILGGLIFGSNVREFGGPQFQTDEPTGRLDRLR